MYSSVSAIPQTIDVGTRKFNAATINDADTTPDALIGTTAKQVALSGYGVNIRRPAIRTKAPSSTTRISQAQTETQRRIICDHAAPPVGFHYECTSGNSCACSLKPNAVATCPTGQTKNSAGVCVETAACPTGQTKNSAGVCVATTTCPAGTTKDVLSGACVANTGNTGGGTGGGATTPPAPSTTSGWVTAAVAIAGLLAVAGRIGR